LDGSTGLARRAYEIAKFSMTVRSKHKNIHGGISSESVSDESQKQSVKKLSISSIDSEKQTSYVYTPPPSSIPWIYLISTRAGGLGLILCFCPLLCIIFRVKSSSGGRGNTL
jgi:hypothetical protein